MGQRLGQHFLKNATTLRAIAESLTVDQRTTIIEIGPGHGELTNVLRQTHPKNPIICLERDYELAPALKKHFENDKNLEIVEGDALETLPELIKSRFLGKKGTITQKKARKPKKYAIIGNIPYYISGHLFRIVGDLPTLPTVVVVLIQKEVAKRLQAIPPDMNRLAASIQIWAKPAITRVVKRGEFTPQPKVDSAVVCLKTEPPKWESVGGKQAYYTAVRALFAQPRKTIGNNLSQSLEKTAGKGKEYVEAWLEELKIDKKRRPETLSIKEISEISKLLANKKVIPIN